MSVVFLQPLDPPADFTAQPARTPDTTYFMDIDGNAAAGRVGGAGGELTPRSSEGPAPAFTTAALTYGKGITCADTAHMPWMPGNFLPPGEWTILLRIKATADWSTLSAQCPLSVSNSTNTWSVRFIIDGGRIRLRLRHFQQPGNSGAYQSDVVSPALTTGEFLAGTEYVIAGTLSTDGVQSLYAGNTLLGSASDVVAPLVASSGTMLSDGLTICGSPFEGAATALTVWAQIMRHCRVPGRATLIARSRTQCRISPTTTGRTVTQLNGALHSLLPGGEAIQSVELGIGNFRLDKLISPTPIHVGGTDGSHPTLGFYSGDGFDWQVVQRTLTRAVTTYGVPKLYLCLDSPNTVDLGGGGSPPFSGSQLTSGYCDQAEYNDGPPVNQASCIAHFQDLLHFVLNGSGLGLTAGDLLIGGPNEPDLGAWTKAQYNAFWAALYAGVKAVDSDLLIGGPEVRSLSMSSWVPQWLAYCAANSCWPDFTTMHFLDDTDTATFATFSNLVAVTAAENSLPIPRCGNTETSGLQIGNIGYSPWTEPATLGYEVPGAASPNDYLLNDWGAGCVGVFLCIAQQLNYVLTHFINAGGVEETDDLIETNDVQQIAYNVLKQWSLGVGANELVVTDDFTRDPGVFTIAWNDGTHVGLFVASLRYRDEQPDQPVLARLIDDDGTQWVDDGTPVTAYLVDTEHSNAYSGGSPDLATVPVPPVHGGNIVIPPGLANRGAVLFIVG